MAKKKPTPDLNSVSADALAEKIARELMISFDSRSAHRLVLMSDDEEDLGGMNFNCVKSTIAKILKEGTP